MSPVTIRLTEEMPPAVVVDVPRSETFAISHGDAIMATDVDVPRDVDPRQYAASIAAVLGVPFDPPPLGVCFALRDDGTWWGYRIARGGGTGRGRTSRQAPIVFRQPAKAAA
jgi:hypothetical protein